ncbi:hypothetical protein DFP83_1198 [Idiomarina fontislapidosi]|uniref:Uncharacterized protein n=1 Tax=Idiomarina fontislapidosi TaxID=263723 RepID=A0A432XJP7_9GAMM|nr:hypothetical protein [Idiomarina fontislapidosi]PYE30286.1 hypothetical protein DFP83_1198 [Idiomarina fontislapidosi]RUO48935.1 hypothetical protein CWE25_13010 [Idiomarina fontislapidosi]
MKFQGAVIKEQGVTFAIVVVKKHILDSPHESEEAISTFMPLFPGMPVVLMAQGFRGIPEYRGRADIVNFLANLHPSQIPWQEYTYS